MFCCMAGVGVLFPRQRQRGQRQRGQRVAISIDEPLKPEIAEGSSDKHVLRGTVLRQLPDQLSRGQMSQVIKSSSSVPEKVLGGRISLDTIGDSPPTNLVLGIPKASRVKGLAAASASLFHESEILQKLQHDAQHPNIIRLVAPFTSNVQVEHASGPLCVTYDFIALEAVLPLGHDLVTYCENFRWRVKQLVPIDHFKRFVEKIAGALEYMHDRGVVHRDLKPDNVLIDGNLSSPKIADFGVASTPQHQGRDMFAGYCAPEVNDKDHPTSIDIWGLGVLGCSMYDSYPGITARWTALEWSGDEVRGRSPFKKDKNAKIGGAASRLLARDKWLGQPISPKALDLIRHLLRKDPKERWSQQQIKQWVCEA